jgi:hypothetical protein
LTPDLDDSVLLISAPRSGGGGLFVLDQGSVVAIDRVATQGLSAREGRLARIISSGRVASPCGDVLVYDESGLRRSYRVDGLGNMHDALYADDALLIVNTAGNAVEALREDGSVTTWWQGPPRFDAWHVNCLCSDGGSVVATAFGQGTRSSAWRDANGTDGVIIRIPDEVVLVSGLDKPHDPRRIDGLWVVCQSGKSQLLGFDDEGRLQKSRDLGGSLEGWPSTRTICSSARAACGRIWAASAGAASTYSSVKAGSSWTPSRFRCRRFTPSCACHGRSPRVRAPPSPPRPTAFAPAPSRRSERASPTSAGASRIWYRRVHGASRSRPTFRGRSSSTLTSSWPAASRTAATCGSAAADRIRSISRIAGRATTVCPSAKPSGSTSRKTSRRANRATSTSSSRRRIAAARSASRCS